jgi:uncharacterized protein with FMN-binding domain
MTAVRAVLTLMITACFIELDPTDIPANEIPYDTAGGEPYTGEEEGKAQGYVGTVTVKVTLEDGFITAVAIDASDETPTHASQIINQAPGLVVKANSFDIDALSAVSPGSTTKVAIKNAGKAALAKIK